VAERTGDFEWRIEGDEAEIVLYAPDDSEINRVLPAAGLPGVESPVYAVASSQNFGWVAASTTHAAPDLISAPARGLLLTAGVTIDGLGLPPSELVRLLFRNLSEVSLPRLNGPGVRRSCEAGAWAAAEDGIIEEDNLSFFDPATGDSDALGRRALSAGERDWGLLTKVRLYSVVDVLDVEAAESLDLEQGALALTVEAGAGELGRIALSVHRERILSRIRAGIDFDAEDDLPAAPLDSEEAADLLAATHAAANFADGRASLTLHALRRALADITGELRPVASWSIGGFQERDGSMVHRRGLARISGGGVMASGDSVAAGTGARLGSAPPFQVAEIGETWPWEEVGLLERVATLEDLEQHKA
jgi:tRNA-splicing ligase RtcB